MPSWMKLAFFPGNNELLKVLWASTKLKQTKLVSDHGVRWLLPSCPLISLGKMSPGWREWGNSDSLLILPFGVIDRVLDPRGGWMLLLSWALASSIWNLSVQFLCAPFPELMDGQIPVCVDFWDNDTWTHPGSLSGANPITYVLACGRGWLWRTEVAHELWPLHPSFIGGRFWWGELQMFPLLMGSRGHRHQSWHCTLSY